MQSCTSALVKAGIPAVALHLAGWHVIAHSSSPLSKIASSSILFLTSSVPAANSGSLIFTKSEKSQRAHLGLFAWIAPPH
jgi:hypothetical protein